MLAMTENCSKSLIVGLVFQAIAAWQALHDRFQYIVLGPLSLLMFFWFPTMLARPWTGASIQRHRISGVRRWCWVTCVTYCLWNRSPQGWIFNFAGGRWWRGLRSVASINHKIFIDELRPGVVADCGLSLEPHRFNIGKRDQESFCCFLPNSISQVINGCNESFLYELWYFRRHVNTEAQTWTEQVGWLTWTCQPRGWEVYF